MNTKAKLTLLLVLSLFVFGCSSLKFDVGDDAKELAIRLASKRAGHQLKEKHPELVKDGVLFCKAILETEGTNFEPLLNKTLDYLLQYVKDPLLRSDLKDVLALIKVEGTPKFDIGRARVAVEGFLEGLEIGS